MLKYLFHQTTKTTKVRQKYKSDKLRYLFKVKLLKLVKSTNLVNYKYIESKKQSIHLVLL